MRSRHTLLLLCAALLLLWLLQPESRWLSWALPGIALAVALVPATASIHAMRDRARRARIAAGLLFCVASDIVRSNIAVAGVVLRGRGRPANPEFMRIPIELRNTQGLTALACIITATPGTVWAGLSADCSVLTIHVLDLKDRESWIRTIKHRYERPLLEIFE